MKDYTIPLPPETLSEELSEAPPDSVITSSDLITTDKYAWSVLQHILQQPRTASFHSPGERIFELHTILWQHRHDYASSEFVVGYTDERTQKLIKLYINGCKETLRNIWAIIYDCRSAAVEVGGVQTIVLVGSQREQLDLYVKDIKMWTVYLTETLQRLGRNLLKRSPSMGLESFLLLADKVANAIHFFLRSRNGQHLSRYLDQRGQSALTCNTCLVSEIIKWGDIVNIFRAAGASKEEIMTNKSFIMDFIYRLPILNISGGVKMSHIQYNASGNADAFSYVTPKSRSTYSIRTGRYGPLGGGDEPLLMGNPLPTMAMPTPNSTRTRRNSVSEKRVRFEDKEPRISNSSRQDPEPAGFQHNQYLDSTRAQQYASAQASDYHADHHHNHIHYHHYHSFPSYQPPVPTNTNPRVLPDAPEAPISPLHSFSALSSSPSSSNQHITDAINENPMPSGIQMRPGYLELIKKEWEQRSRMRDRYIMCLPSALEQPREKNSSLREADDARKERERQERVRKIEKERAERMRHRRMSTGGGGGCGDNDNVCYW